jgi:hypothetical protein
VLEMVSLAKLAREHPRLTAMSPSGTLAAVPTAAPDASMNANGAFEAEDIAKETAHDLGESRPVGAEYDQKQREPDRQHRPEDVKQCRDSELQPR